MSRPHPVLIDMAAGRGIAAEAVTSAVVDSAIEHRVAGLLLSELGGRIARVPHPAAAALLAFDMAVRSRREEQMEALANTVDRLAPLDFVLFKGAASAYRWFSDPSHRPFADIDIVLGPKESLASAIRRLAQPDGALQNPALPSSGYLGSVEVDVDGVRVDVQTEALRMGIKPVDLASWWKATTWLELPGVGTLRVFDSDADMALFLLHQARDRFRFLIGMAEAHMRLRKPHDWDRVESLTRKEGIWDQVATALEVICDELGIECPIDKPDSWRAHLWRRLWKEDVRLLGEVGRIRHVRRARWLMPMLARGRFKDTLRWLWWSAFPPDGVLRLRYPSDKGPYLWRLVSRRILIISRRRIWVWRHRSG